MHRCRHASVALALSLIFLGLQLPALWAATWYVRPDGGTRYSAAVPTGQCNGTADAAYRGKGVNQPCAFNDVRSFWTDGARCSDGGAGSTCWRWIGTGGDTYLIRGSIAEGKAYRVGQTGPNPNDFYGLAGNPYGSGAPPPPSGTAAEHTRILGGNFADCARQDARTQLHGGYGVLGVLSMRGSSYVDLGCLDLTDHSNCGRASQANACNSNFPLSDYAAVGILWNRDSAHDVLDNVRIHGMAVAGMSGPTGDGVVMHHLELTGNAAAGWDADPGDKTSGTGSLLVDHFNISWNGCAEEYPLIHPLPYADCTDDNGGGYGDGFGTATAPSNPGWHIVFDDGIVSYNTQDGLDALHLTGADSSMTVTHTQAFGNMGQQLKIGGAGGTISSSVVFTNCNSLRQAIPGTPAGYNRHLSDFCRAADTGIVLSVGDGRASVFTDNVVYAASATALEVDTAETCSRETCSIRHENNIFVGFRSTAATGYPDGGTGEYANPVYLAGAPVYEYPHSVFSGNVTWHAKRTWKCPETAFNERNAICADPHLADESWPVFGVVNTARTGPLPPPTRRHASIAPQISSPIAGAVVLSFGALFLGWNGFARKRG